MKKEDTVMMITNISSNVVVLEFTKLDSEHGSSNIPPNEDGTMFMGPNAVRVIEKCRIRNDKLTELIDRGIIKTSIV